MINVNWHCPLCHGEMAHFEHGQGDYPWHCDPCGLGLQVNVEAGTARSRRWDRIRACGLEEHWPLAVCAPAPNS